MRIKSLPNLLLLFLFCCGIEVSYAQNIDVRNPSVGTSFKSDYGTTRITRVWTDAKRTYVLFEYRAKGRSQDISIAIASKTRLIADGSRNYGIESWGLYDEDGFSRLELDEHYSLGDMKVAPLCMVFPKIPSSTRSITVEENVSGGFWWRDISLRQGGGNNSSRHSNGKHSDKEGANRNSWDGHAFKGDDDGNVSNGSSSSDEDYSPRPSRRVERPFEVHASGSGFALSEDGMIATCYHVIDQARRIRVRGVNGDFDHPYYVEVVSSDRKNDLAILKISDEAFLRIDSIPYGVESSPTDVGESVFVLGYPLRAVMGDEIKLTSGLVSAWSGYQGDTTEYQISAVVQSGNSGGPVFNYAGNVIGVVNARLTMIEGAAYAVKERYLHQLHSPLPKPSPSSGKTPAEGLSISDLVKKVKTFVYIIEVE